MSKRNKLLIVILAFVVVCVMGYALFSETITVTGTATASGSFDIEVSCEDYGVGFMTDHSDSYDGSANCSINGDTVITTSTLPKPGENTYFIIGIKNNGTIPAKLKTITSPNNYDIDYKTAGDKIYYDTNYGLLGMYTMLDSEGNLTDIIGDSATIGASLVVQPNEYIGILVMHEWDKEYSKDNGLSLPSEGAKMNYNITLGFEQITVQ